MVEKIALFDGNLKKPLQSNHYGAKQQAMLESGKFRLDGDKDKDKDDD
jgi:hypothetical protein